MSLLAPDHEKKQDVRIYTTPPFFLFNPSITFCLDVIHIIYIPLPILITREHVFHTI